MAIALTLLSLYFVASLPLLASFMLVMRVVRRSKLTNITQERLANVQLTLEVARRDHDAMLQALQAIARTMLDVKNSTERSPEQNVSSFVHTLEYARDTFARTTSQRKAVETIISSVKTSYGEKAK